MLQVAPPKVRNVPMTRRSAAAAAADAKQLVGANPLQEYTVWVEERMELSIT